MTEEISRPEQFRQAVAAPPARLRTRHARHPGLALAGAEASPA